MLLYGAVLSVTGVESAHAKTGPLQDAPCAVIAECSRDPTQTGVMIHYKTNPLSQQISSNGN
jgi:hypothetical protein